MGARRRVNTGSAQLQDACATPLASLQHFPKLGFIDDLYAELFRFVEFAAGFGASDQVIGFLAYAAGHVTAERFDFFRGFFARH